MMDIDKTRAGFVLRGLDNLRLAQLADDAIKRQRFEVCGLLRDEINDRAVNGKLGDIYYNAAQIMGLTDNPLYDFASSVNAQHPEDL